MDYNAIIKQYKSNRVGCIRECKIIQFCLKSPNIEIAISRAVMARDENGNKHSHQRRFVKDNTLAELYTKLLKIKDKIIIVNNFDELFELIYKTYVFNDRFSLTIYDTALRLGFYLNKFPEKIYLHAGTKIGIEKLIGKIENHFVMKKYLPEPFKSCDLNEYELEDLFCIYKDEIKK